MRVKKESLEKNLNKIIANPMLTHFFYISNHSLGEIINTSVILDKGAKTISASEISI